MSAQIHLPLLLELITNLAGPTKTTWTLEQIAQQTHTPAAQIMVLGLENAPKIDEVRNFLSRSQIKAGPKQKTQIFAILNLDQARTEVQQVLLKSLEEPPSGATFVLTCTNLGQILPTVQSRCQIKTIYNYQLDEEKLARVGEWWQLESLAQKKYYELITLTTDLLKLQTKLLETEYKICSKFSSENEYKNTSNVSKIHGKIAKKSSSEKETEKISELVVARVLLLDLLNFTHYRTLTPLTSEVLKHYRLLTQNVNAKLVLEDLLFAFKKTLDAAG